MGLKLLSKSHEGPVPMSQFLPAALALEKAKADSNRAIRKEFSTLHPINDVWAKMGTNSNLKLHFNFQVMLYSQLSYFELGPKKFDLSYFLLFPRYTIFLSPVMLFLPFPLLSYDALNMNPQEERSSRFSRSSRGKFLNSLKRMFGKNLTRNVLPTQQPKRPPLFKINPRKVNWIGIS